MPKIETRTNKPTRVSIKAFQESIKNQAMYNSACDHNLCFLGMVLRASYFYPLSNGNLFAPPTDSRPFPVNAIGTAAQINEVIRLYKDKKKNSPSTVNFALF